MHLPCTCHSHPPAPLSQPRLQLGDLGLQLPHLRLLSGAQLAQQRRANLSLCVLDASLLSGAQVSGGGE